MKTLKNLTVLLLLFCSTAVLAHPATHPENIKVLSPDETRVNIGECSRPIKIHLLDRDNNVAKANKLINLKIYGLRGSEAKIYLNSSCSGADHGQNIVFTPGTDTRIFYVKSTLQDQITLDAGDPSGALVTTSNPINIDFKASDRFVALISVNGPAGVYIGACSKPIKIQLQNLNGDSAKPTHITAIRVKGLQDAKLYSNSHCEGAGLKEKIMFTPGTDTHTVYLKSNSLNYYDLEFFNDSGVPSSRSYAVSTGAY